MSPRPDASFIPRRIFVTKDCEKPAAPIHSSVLSPRIVVEFFFFFFYVELVEREGEREVCRYYERQIPLAPNSTFIHGSLEVYRKMGTNYIATLTIVRCKVNFTFFYKNYNILEFLKMLRIVRRSLAYFHA